MSDANEIRVYPPPSTGGGGPTAFADITGDPEDNEALETALDLKAPLASPTFTGTVAGITKAMVGLGNADNTSDASKPVSTATQTALDAKEGLLASVPDVDLNTTDPTTLFTSPSGKTTIITKAAIRDASIDLTPIAESLVFLAHGLEWASMRLDLAKLATGPAYAIVLPGTVSFVQDVSMTPRSLASTQSFTAAMLNPAGTPATVVIDVWGYSY